MLFFDHDGRKKLRPASLDGKAIESAKHEVASWLALDPRRREQSDVPSVWKTEFEPDVIAVLGKLSHGRCAFCEEVRTDLVPYRFRPPGYAEPPLEPARKGSYVWLAFNWNNLFPICTDCRPARPNHFPVEGQTRSVPISPFEEIDPRSGREVAILLFPGELLHPHEFGIARIDGIVAPPEHASATIDTFHLNRRDLADRRRLALLDLIDRIETGQWLFTSLALERELLDSFLKGDHGGFLFLFCHRLVRALGSSSGEQETPADKVQDVAKRLAKFAAEPHFVEPLRAAIARIAAEDSGDDGAASVPPEPRDVETSRTAAPGAHATPRIKSVALKNFKSLEDIAFTMPEKLDLAPIDKGPTQMRPPEAPCLMLLGENATGKSSILEAIALACLPEDTVDQLRHMGKLEAARLQLNPRYMGQAGAAKGGQTSIRVEFHDSGARTCRIAASKLTRQAQTEDAPPLLFAFGAHRLTGAGKHSPLLRVATLFDDHTQLANPEEWLRKLDPSALDEVASALRYIIQIDGEFEFIAFEEGNDGESVCMLHFWRPDASAPGGRRPMSQPLKMVSSGYRAVLALVVEILRGLAEANPGMSPHDARMSRAIVLVDEIEAHLHPRWKLHIMSGLRRALPNVTFIVTSHDPLCVRGMFNGEVMALNRYDNASRHGRELPERVERVKDFENVEAMTVDQLLTSPMFGLFSAESESLNRRLAAASDILSQREKGEAISQEDKAILDHLDRSIAAGLPFGQDMINDVVRDAVAQYLKAQREASAGDASDKRKAAVAAVRAFLNEIKP